MAAYVGTEWLNQNALRAYPFREDVRRRPTVDGVPADWAVVPDGFLLDLVMATNFDVQPDVYMKSLSLGGSIATVAVADASDGAVLAVASAPFGPGDERVAVNFSGVAPHDDIRGTAVFGNLGKIEAEYPDGVYVFDPSETMFEARCCRPSIPCVSGLFVAGASGSTESVRLRGDVALVAGSNVRLDFDASRNAIVVNADCRYGFNDRCDCGSDPRTRVMSVNGVSAEDVEIVGDECISVARDGNRIVLSDKCSRPCCGCAELTFLNQKSNEIVTTVGKLEQWTQSLHDRLDDFVRNVLLSTGSLSEYI